MPKAINNETLSAAEMNPDELADLIWKKHIAPRAKALWMRNFKAATKILGESESRKVNVGFPVRLDFSESDAKVKVGIRFAEITSESQEGTFANPFPVPAEELPGEPLPGVDQEAKEESAKIRRKRVKKALAEDTAGDNKVTQLPSAQEEGEDQATA